MSPQVKTKAYARAKAVAKSSSKGKAYAASEVREPQRPTYRPVCCTCQASPLFSNGALGE